MATIFPSIRACGNDLGAYRELDALRSLEASLPDGFEVFHSIEVHSTGRQSEDGHGEIDLIVTSPHGQMALVEIKAGDVLLRPDGIFKTYRNKEKNVSVQVQTQYSAMRRRLSDANLSPYLTNCLVLPDFRVGDASVVGFPRDRIIDATEYDHLAHRILEMMSSGVGKADQAVLRRFLCNQLDVCPDLQVLGGQLGRETRRRADGLATWVPRMRAPLGTFHIVGTAGSGKTQLSLHLLSEAANQGLRALYVCFNRTLADAIGKLAPASTRVSSYHELCVDHYRQSVGEPDFASSGIFGEVVDCYIRDVSSGPVRYDLMVIDEAQDFEPEWVASLLPQVKDDGRIYLLEDPDQQIYQRKEFGLSDAVVVECGDNFRTPQMICQTINLLGLANQAIVSKSSYVGDMPVFQTYSDHHGLLRQTEEAVEALLAEGIALEDIAVLTGHGHAKSAVLRLDRIGRFTTRRFTGGYSADGLPVWSNGDLLVESVYRYKGQCAAGVVLTEFAFDELTPQDKRKLFVGMTRATLRLSLIMSTEADHVLKRVAEG